MRKTLFTLPLLFAALFTAYAQQDFINKKEAEVQVITNEGKVLSGKTRYTFIFDLQEEIVFYDKHNEMQVFRPFEIKGFTIENKKFVSLEQKGILAGLNRFFLHQQQDGAMKLYTVYSLQSPEMTIRQETYIAKGTEKLYATKSLKFLNFKKDMAAYVSEASDLAARIADKTYTATDLETIVEEYNGYFERQNEVVSATGK